jgi:hypothetical protein
MFFFRGQRRRWADGTYITHALCGDKICTAMIIQLTYEI